MIEIIPEFWMMSRASVSLPGKVREERMTGLTVITPQTMPWQR